MPAGEGYQSVITKCGWISNPGWAHQWDFNEKPFDIDCMLYPTVSITPSGVLLSSSGNSCLLFG